MSREPSHDLIDSLTEDLRPVKPLPPLRFVIAGVILLWLLVAAVGVPWLGARPDLSTSLFGGGSVSVVFLALTASGASGLVAALALGIPGRERLVRYSMLVAISGMAVAAGLGTVLFVQSPVAVAPWKADVRCLMEALALGLLPALGVIAFAGRAAPYRPLVLTVAAAAGAASLGSVAAQAACAMPDFRHLLMGHVLGPVAAAMVLSLPLLFVLRQMAKARTAAD